MWDLSSPTRDRTHVPCIGRRILYHWTTREVPYAHFLIGSFVLFDIKPQPTPASPGDPPRPAGRSDPGSYGVTALPWVPVHVKPCVRPPSVESLFPSVLWSSCTQAPWPSKSNALGAPPPDARPPGWGGWHGAQSSHSCGRTYAIQVFSSLWVTHPSGMGFDYIAKAPLLLSCVATSLSLGVEYLFW